MWFQSLHAVGDWNLGTGYMKVKEKLLLSMPSAGIVARPVCRELQLHSQDFSHNSNQTGKFVQGAQYLTHAGTHVLSCAVSNKQNIFCFNPLLLTAKISAKILLTPSHLTCAKYKLSSLEWFKCASWILKIFSPYFRNKERYHRLSIVLNFWISIAFQSIIGMSLLFKSLS